MATAEQIIAFAEAQEGKKYVFGTEGPNTFDCSGLMQYVFGHFGIKLPRTTGEQVRVGTAVPTKLSALQPGDLVFSNWEGAGNAHSHVGMYVGGGKLINAPHTGTVVQLATLSPGYMAHVDAVRRVLKGGQGGAGIPIDPANPVEAVAGGVTDLLGGAPLVGAVQGAADALKGMVSGVTSVGRLAETLGKLALPTTMVRVASGALGITFLMFGIFFLLREVKS